jgi:hypothetical protein
MLGEGFAVFGEADYPPGALGTRVDVLGIELACNWFLACEVDKLWGSEDKILQRMQDGLRRLQTFWLRKEFPPSHFWEGAYRAVSECQLGYGLMGGLYWVEKGSESAVLRFFQQPEQEARNEAERKFTGSLKGLNGFCVQPPLVRESPRGQYYLLSACFPIPQPCRS